VSIESLWVLCLLLFLDGATLAVFTTPLLLAYGKYHPPWIVALCAAAASAAGGAIQITLLRWLLSSRHPWTARFAPLRHKIESAVGHHPSASFVALVVARATPLPDAPLKLAAAAANYPVSRYCAAILLGSIPYYFALALLGHALKLPAWVLITAAALIVFGVLIDRIRRNTGAAP
jgi:membrane protein YqaA with SNARE-associated domain